MDEKLAGGGDAHERLDRLYDRLHEFCKTNALSLHTSKFTRALLHYPNEKEYPCGFLDRDLGNQSVCVTSRILTGLVYICMYVCMHACMYECLIYVCIGGSICVCIYIYVAG